MTMTCGHGENYACSHCGLCYQCRHEIVRGNWPSISVGWKCPDGTVRPAYGPWKRELDGATQRASVG